MIGKRIRFTTDLRINYDSDHYLPLLTVMNNLLSNSVEAIEDQERFMGAHERGAETILTVTDTGTGIAELEKDMIFEPGFTTKFNQEGFAATGIGLSRTGYCSFLRRGYSFAF